MDISNFKRQSFDYIIGIDPDVDKSGIAFIERKTRRVTVDTLPFPELIEAIVRTRDLVKEQGGNLLVVMEAGYLNRSNWHLDPRDSKAVAAAKGVSAGRNHQTGHLIAEMCRHYGVVLQEARPLPKSWHGPDRKITHEEITYFMGPIRHTNQEGRDAALLAWIHADLPIRVKPIK